MKLSTLTYPLLLVLYLFFGFNQTQAQINCGGMVGPKSLAPNEIGVFITNMVPGSTYTWRASGSIEILSIDGNQATVRGISAGSGLLVVSNGSCKVKRNISVQDSFSLDCSTMSIEGISGVGLNQTITQTAEISAIGVSYRWYVSGSISIVGGDSQKTVTVRGNSLGSGTLTCVISKLGSSCTQSKTMRVLNSQ